MSSKKRRKKGRAIKMTLGDLLRKLENGEIRFGPIRRDALSEQQQMKARDVWERCVKYWSIPTFEQFELSLMRDVDPDQEIRAWELIASAFEEVMRLKPESDRDEVITKLALMSMGGQVPQS